MKWLVRSFFAEVSLLNNIHPIYAINGAPRKNHDHDRQQKRQGTLIRQAHLPAQDSRHGHRPVQRDGRHGTAASSRLGLGVDAG
ncbi:hypothetical protein D3C78_1532100 [compost metagenome]